MSSITDLLQPDGRVLFLTNDFPPRHGGIQTFVRQLCGELPPERVVVHAPNDAGAAAHDARLPFPVVRDPRSLLLPTPQLLGRVRETMRAHGVQQVVFGASVPLGVLAPQLRDEGAAWQVALTHGHEVWWAALPGTRHVLRRVAREVDVTTYVSEYTRRRLAPVLQEGARQFVRLSPTADPEFHRGWDGSSVREELGISQHSPVVVCVARLVRRKGQDRLVRIWPEVLRRFPDAHLLLVGDGPDRSRLQRLIARLDVRANVTLTGAVHETPPYYAAADVFAMPVRSRFFGLEVEALGISYLEAAAMGLVVVPGRHGGAPEAAPNADRPPSR